MSAKAKEYTQCCLHKPTETGVRVTTSWIPSRLAVVGNPVRLRGDDNEWVEGWKVVSCGATATREETQSQAQDHKKQRKASDI